MRLAVSAAGGERPRRRRQNGHARDHESDQPLEQQHCLLRSLDEKTALTVKAPFGRPPQA